MATILYFQPSAKTFAPEKLTGVRDIIEKRHHRVQIIEEKPTSNLVEELWALWNPLGAIIDCGGEYNDIDAGIFGSHPVVFIGHNPDTLPKSCLLVSNDQCETARAAARELLATDYENFASMPYWQKTVKDSPSVFKERNEKWIPKMQKAMQKAPVMFNFGAGHLIGDYGIIQLLQNAGYNVEQVESK